MSREAMLWTGRVLAMSGGILWGLMVALNGDQWIGAALAGLMLGWGLVWVWIATGERSNR